MKTQKFVKGNTINEMKIEYSSMKTLPECEREPLLANLLREYKYLVLATGD